MISEFIPGVDLPLPMPNATLAKQIAPLRAEESNADSGELKYEHFSLKMNKARRMAAFTATNIDGKAYLNIDRRSGLVAEPRRVFRRPFRLSHAAIAGSSSMA